MKQNFKRFLSWTLALLMALSLLPAGLLSVPAHAEELVDELVNDAQAEEFTVQATRVKVVFVEAEHGKYIVNDSEKAFPQTFNQALTNFHLLAYPDEGYRFLGWYDDQGNRINDEKDTYIEFTNDCTVTARFATQDTATFKVGNKTFTGLQAAIDYAQGSSDKTITLASDGSIYGDYTIPAGITLLIPFDAAGTTYTDVPGYTTTEDKTRTAFRKLTMEEGASIIVEGEGAISVGGKHYTCSNSNCCITTGPYGQIQMEAGSSITLKNRANLYAWGYITGDGQITANSGAEVYEYFQIMDWRGGSCTSDMEGNQKKVFPFSQYYVQNIEAELTIQAGASEKAYLSITALSGLVTKSVFIDYVGEGSLFSLKNNGTFTKKYDPKNDRIIFKITGDAELSEIQLKMRIGIFNFDFKSSAYVLPINNNVDMQILSGTTTVSKDAALLPGVAVSIAEGAELKVADSASLYVYDADQWSKAYVQGSNNLGISPVAYSPSGKGSRTVSDATIDVNGTLTAAGAIYTTEGGANICSSKGAGVYVQQGQRGKSSETYQCIQDDRTPNYTAIPITPAKLHNGDGSYEETRNYPQGSEIKYEYNAWGGKPAVITVSFDANGGFGTMSAQSGTAGQNITLQRNCFTYADHTFTGWNTVADGTGTRYDDGATVSFTEDTTLYAQWTKKPVVTFSANGGDGSMSPQTVEPNAATPLIANAFTRADYDFTGWNTAADGSGTAYADQAAVTLSGNCTLYAQWTLHKYHVRWLNWDRSVLQEGYYTCEEYAAWDDWTHSTPTRPEDENYTYEFANRWVPWDSQTDGWGFYPHKDVDFTAQFNQFEKLTVTFNANGGTGTMDPVKIPNGSSDTSYKLPECRFTAPQGKLFDGWLITGTVGESIWDPYELENGKWNGPELLAFSDLTLKASWKACTHTWDAGTDTTPATCTDSGVKTFTCSVCNATKTETIPAKGHQWENATCTAPKTCSVCSATDGNPLGHTFGDWCVTTAATCTEKGEKTRTCQREGCNAKETEEVAASGHQWTAATCTAPKTCSVCSATDGNALGHAFGEWSVTKAADYVTPGEKTHTCSVCKETRTETIPSILQQLQDLQITAAEDGRRTMTLPTGKKVLVLLAGYSQAGQLQSIQVLSANETGEVTFTRPDSEKAMLFFLQEDYKPLHSCKVTQ